MAVATFDGDALIIQLPSIGAYDVESELYSAWKEWVILGNNSQYPQAFDTTGGDSIGVGQEIAPYFFCRNDLGWRIRAPDANGEVSIQGNLFPRDSAQTLFEVAAGFSTFVRQEVSSQAIVATVGGADVGDIATAVWAEPVKDVNIATINNATILGRGLNLDKWRGDE